MSELLPIHKCLLRHFRFPIYLQNFCCCSVSCLCHLLTPCACDLPSPNTATNANLQRQSLLPNISYLERSSRRIQKGGQVCNAALILPHSPTGGHRLRTTKNAPFHFSVSFHHQSHIVCPATEKDYVVSMRFSAIRLICSLEFHSFLHENTHCNGLYTNSQ